MPAQGLYRCRKVQFSFSHFLVDMPPGVFDLTICLGARLRYSLTLLLNPLPALLFVLLMDFGTRQLQGAFELRGLLLCCFESTLGELANAFGLLSALLENTRHWFEEDLLQIDRQENTKEGRREGLDQEVSQGV